MLHASWRLPPRASPLYIAAILLLAAALRLTFFVGLVSGDPQDDGVYYGNALALYREGPTYFARYRGLPADWLPNPIDQFHFRPVVTYPIAASFALFGPGEAAAAAWSLACSLLIVFVVYRLGRATHDATTGLLAALLCAIYPLEVINATRVLSDVPLALCAGCALLSVVEACRRRHPFLYVLGGAAAAGAYLANGRGLIVLPIAIVCAGVHAAAGRSSWRAPLLVAGGFGAIFAIEAAIYFLRTGDPLLNFRVHSGAALFKYLNEPVSTIDWGWLRLHYTNGYPFELTDTVFLLNGSPTRQFGVFFYLFVAAGVFSLWMRRNRLLLAIAAAALLFFEFAPVHLAFDADARAVDYRMIFKQQRFLLMLSAPLLVVAAFFLRAVGTRSRMALVAILALLAVTSLQAISQTWSFYRSGLRDLREVAAFVESQPNHLFWSDFWAVEHLKIFSKYRARNLRVLDTQTRPTDIAGGCVILGGSRGVELQASYVAGALPSFVRDVLDTGNAPRGWTLMREIDGELDAQRSRNLRVYCLPPG
jgi:4-amino-4-deoxy-L-arabinose transferase-like glycosyltransferase